jgi:hypothetical protein
MQTPLFNVQSLLHYLFIMEKSKRQMDRIIFRWFGFLLALTLSTTMNGQTVVDLKAKTPSNEKERTLMLDILRAKLYEDYKQEFVFVVRHFKASGAYAWFEGDAQRKDGKQIRFDSDFPHDCCGVTALFKKGGSKWLIVESGAFGTDVWWSGIGSRHPEAPRSIFPSEPYYFQE